MEAGHAGGLAVADDAAQPWRPLFCLRTVCWAEIVPQVMTITATPYQDATFLDNGLRSRAALGNGELNVNTGRNEPGFARLTGTPACAHMLAKSPGHGRLV